MKKSLFAIIATLAVFSNAQAACQFFKHDGFDGPSFTMTANEHRDFVGSRWNDQISSIKVSNRCKAVVYQHKDFRGDRERFTNNSSFVGKHWNDKISSVKCKCGGRDRDNYDRDNYDRDDFRGDGGNRLRAIEGMNGGNANRRLMEMGYHRKKSLNVRTEYWWSRARARCVAVTIKNNRVDAVNKQPNSMCNK